ncbi:cytochrome b/b6 protein [Arthrobacter sp. Hiyo1]|uniref:hypothetical protein n=1 Tax=Arthrobacter sp. Hiyo1 TaxID=1588020 RepID=UPI0006A3B2C1|nr:hypothetical protein [Arthrobacter sp. Hiyo1]GAP59738.1 cytochrome b/b6 protein [Arthrobacter sp. Hiyo1]
MDRKGPGLGVAPLPPDKLLPEGQPSYVASWIYVFGMGAVAAFVYILASGAVLALNGPRGSMPRP